MRRLATLCLTLLLILMGTSHALAGQTLGQGHWRSTATTLHWHGIMENHRGNRTTAALIIDCAALAHGAHPALRLQLDKNPEAFFHGARNPAPVLIRVDEDHPVPVRSWVRRAARQGAVFVPHAVSDAEVAPIDDYEKAILAALPEGERLEIHFKDSGDSVGRSLIALDGLHARVGRGASVCPM